MNKELQQSRRDETKVETRRKAGRDSAVPLRFCTLRTSVLFLCRRRICFQIFTSAKRQFVRQSVQFVTTEWKVQLSIVCITVIRDVWNNDDLSKWERVDSKKKNFTWGSPSDLWRLLEAVVLAVLWDVLGVQQDGPAVHQNFLSLIQTDQDVMGVLAAVTRPPAQDPRQIVTWAHTRLQPLITK